MALEIVTERVEIEYLDSGQACSVFHLAPVAYRDAGALRRIASNWLDSGIVDRPHIVDAAPFVTSMANDGLYRLHPVRTDLSRYIEIGAPMVKPVLSWQSVGFSAPIRAGNAVIWSRPQADLVITHGGHFVKLEMPLKGGYVPPNGQIAFPISLVGLTRLGDQILADGVPVMNLRKPVVYDGANRLDVRSINYSFVQVTGQSYILFTLPSLAGMTQPVIDPTLTQPSDTGDGEVYGSDATYATARSTSTGFSITANIISLENDFWTPNYYNRRGYLKFDSSSLGAGSTVTQVNLKMTPTDINHGALGGDFDIQIAKYDWSGSDPITAGNRETVYDGNLVAALDDNIFAAVTALTVDVEATSGNLNTAWINKTGFTYYGLLHSLDRAGTELALSGSYVSLASGDHATPAKRPQLVVTYTTGAGPPARSRIVSLPHYRM